MSGLLQSPEDSDDDDEESLGSCLDEILPSGATQCVEDMLSSLGHYGRKGQKSPLMWKDFCSMSEENWQEVLHWLPRKEVGQRADLEDPTKFAGGHIKDLNELHQRAQQDLITMSRPKSSRIRMSRPKSSRNRPASHSSAASMAEKFESIDRHSTWIDWLTVPEKHSDDDAGSSDEDVLFVRDTLLDASLDPSEVRNVEDAAVLAAALPEGNVGVVSESQLIEAMLVAENHAKELLLVAQDQARLGLPWQGWHRLNAAKLLIDDSSRT